MSRLSYRDPPQSKLMHLSTLESSCSIRTLQIVDTDRDLRQLLDRRDNTTLANNDDKVVQAVSIVEVRITSRESVRYLPIVL